MMPTYSPESGRYISQTEADMLGTSHPMERSKIASFIIFHLHTFLNFILLPSISLVSPPKTFFKQNNNNNRHTNDKLERCQDHDSSTCITKMLYQKFRNTADKKLAFI